MTTAIAFLVLAAAGALTRAVVAGSLNRRGRPLGTLAVNVVGSFGLGLLSTTAAPLATVVGTGCIGAFTTFSTFSRDVAVLAADRHRARAALYVAGSCVLAVSAAWLGLHATSAR